MGLDNLGFSLHYLIIRIPKVAEIPLLSHGSGAGDAQW